MQRELEVVAPVRGPSTPLSGSTGSLKKMRSPSKSARMRSSTMMLGAISRKLRARSESGS
jgi:hypothetical protein